MKNPLNPRPDGEHSEKSDVEIQNAKEEVAKPKSNIRMLGVIAALFAGFVVSEIIGAFASDSLSLLGDAAAMSVDVFTYLANMWAEWTKSKYGSVDLKTRWILEVYVPTFSLCALISVTIWVTIDAINTIITPDDEDEVDVLFLYLFASGNMLIDIISYYLFYEKWGSVFQEDDKERRKFSLPSPDEMSIVETFDRVVIKKNLNMMSAFTHVGGDTLRTLSVFIAAAVCSISGASGALCDAWAAVVVTITIIGIIVPLACTIWTVSGELSELQKSTT